MTTLNITVAKNDRYFTESLILIDHTDYVSPDMGEDNIDKIIELLPVKYKHKTIIAIDKVTDVITINHKDIQINE